MKSGNWKDTAELIGIAAIVASLIFVGLQMRQEQEIAQAQAYVDGAANFVELSSLIVDNQDAWMRGLYDEDLSDIERAQFEQIARTWHLRLVNQAYVWDRVGGQNVESLINTAAYDIYVHPGLRRWIESHVERGNERREGRQLSPETFTGRVVQKLADMDADAVPIPSEKQYYLSI